jgi:hypothetical protein
MVEERTQLSRMGIASLALSLVSGAILVGVYRLVLYLVSLQPSGADTVGYAFWKLGLMLLTVSAELVALGLGVAGTLQRRRKRSLAILGATCSVLVLVLINLQVGLADVASLTVGLLEGPPVVHDAGSGNS